MKIRVIFIFLSIMWMGLNAQTVSIYIQGTAGDCLLNSNCEDNTICYDLQIKVDEPNWELRSYNIWVNYPSPPLLSYNSDNACLTQNGGDTDNNQNGQYRVGGINGYSELQPNVPTTIHTICFEYANESLLFDSLIIAGGTAIVYGFPFESTITLVNSVSGETSGFSISSTDAIPISFSEKQTIDVVDGWSGISAWMQPADPDIESIMAPAVDNLVVMYNLTDGIYYPANNINTINNWNYKSGYIIKVTDDAMLSFCGSEPDSKNINLMAGWNVIPVLNNSEVPVELVFSELGENLIIAKEIAGYQIYYPAFGINSLSTLQPAKAYFVKVLESCSITFPEVIVSQPAGNQQYYFEVVSPWNRIHKTPETHVFCFDGEAASFFEMGDMIGAFDQAGNCSGMMEVLDPSASFALSVFGNDETTEGKDGLDESEVISFRLFKPGTGEEFNLELLYKDDSPANGNFVSNGISFVKNVVMNSTGTGSHNYLSGVELNVYPNPTSGDLKFKLNGDIKIDGKIILTDSRGRLLFTTDLLHEKSISFKEFDLSDYNPGIYYLRVVSDNYFNIQKIILK